MFSKFKSLSKKKKITTIMSASLAVVAIIGVAFAFLVGRDEKVNTFTYGNVDIEVVEPLWDAANPTGIIENVVPMMTYDKDPAITNTGKTNAYVYMRVWMPKVDDVDLVVDQVQADGTYLVHANDQEIFTTTKNTNNTDKGTWEIVDAGTDTYIDDGQAYNYYLYTYSVPLTPGETTATLFDKITAVDIAHGEENIFREYSNIVVEGFAIQSQFGDTSVDTPAEAWDMYVKQEGYQWPDNPVPNTVSFLNFDRTEKIINPYYSATTGITVPDPITSDLGVNAFLGYKGENGVLYQSKDEITAEDLYVYDRNDKKKENPLNINPKLVEVIRYANVEEGTDTIMLVPNHNATDDEGNALWSDANPNPVIIDRGGQLTSEYVDGSSEWFVYGFKDFERAEKTGDMTDIEAVHAYLSDYVTVQGDGFFEVKSYSPSTYIGTGIEISVYKNSEADLAVEDRTLVEKIYLVIFGDLNKDSTCNAVDVSLISDKLDNSVDYDYEDPASPDYNPALVRASDVDGDGVITKIDLNFISNHSLLLITIDQTNGCAKS